jgi:peptidoglycan/LPS O-acetylase OafA/YrhL
MPDRDAVNRIPEFDGLRGLAILLVCSGHYFSVPGYGMVRLLDGYWFRLGWTGVDLFFVLSGFLIGGILQATRESERYFQTFYIRRGFRIIPLYYAWILLYLVLFTFGRGFLVARIGTMQGIDAPILAQFLFLQNLLPSLVTVIAFWWFNTTWSLAVEEQFYLVAPLVVKYLSRRALTASLLAVLIAAPLLRWFVRLHFNSGPELAYRLMPCRADSLAIGMLAALAWNDVKIRDWLTEQRFVTQGLFAILFAGVAFLWRYNSNPGVMLTQIFGYTWLALFFAVGLLLALLRPASPVAAFLRIGFLRDIGRVSYCIYIVHTAVFLFCHRLISHALPAVTDGKAAAVSLLAALIAYVVAKCSWKFFEGPLVRRGHAYTYGTTSRKSPAPVSPA